MSEASAPTIETLSPYFKEEEHDVFHMEEHRDDTGAKMAFWLFLYTEIFLFAAMFILYAVYRTMYIDDFHNAAAALDTKIGAINTIVLLFSSMTVVLAIVAVQKSHKSLALIFLGITIACGAAFLVVKSFEWGAKFDHGIHLQTKAGIDAGKGAALLTPGSGEELPRGQIIFYSLYYVMTGTHALHIIIGMILLGVTFYAVAVDHIRADQLVLLENIGLYWHIVDLIWIYLFPLYYLIT